VFGYPRFRDPPEARFCKPRATLDLPVIYVCFILISHGEENRILLFLVVSLVVGMIKMFKTAGRVGEAVSLNVALGFIYSLGLSSVFIEDNVTMLSRIQRDAPKNSCPYPGGLQVLVRLYEIPKIRSY
jgi:hypothetical protein